MMKKDLDNKTIIINTNQKGIYDSTINNIQKALKDYQSPLKDIQDDMKLYKSPFDGIFNNYKNNILPIITSQSYINKLTLANNVFDSLKPMVNNYATQNIKYFNNIVNSLNISNFISDYVKKYQNIMDAFLEAAKILPKSRLSGMDSTMLNKYYWVIPFEYDYSKVEYLSKYKTRVEFEKYIIKYFNDNRVKRLFSKIKKQFKEKDKRELIKQIEESYGNGNYAICITSLMTLFDGSTIILLDPKSDNQHTSYKVIDTVLEYINTRPFDEYSYELYLKVDILNNFIIKLYENITNLKESRRKLLLSRHLNSHGVKYLNNKVNVLRLLNALYFCNIVIEELNLSEQFTKIKNDKKFSKINNNSSNQI